MKLYLSSYRLGDQPEKLQALVGKSGAKAAVCVNAVDNDPHYRNKVMLPRELADIRSLGFLAEELDLRNYFGKPGLVEKLQDYDLIWLSGGNTFLLRKAMQQSGFNEVVEQLIKPSHLVYAGYSAAVCVVSPCLRGLELVDNKDAAAAGYNQEIIWDGYGLIDYYPIVHYQSDHPESPLVEKELEAVKSQGAAYKTLRDGEVIIYDS